MTSSPQAVFFYMTRQTRVRTDDQDTLKRMARALGLVFALLATGIIAGFALNSLYVMESNELARQATVAAQHHHQTQQLVNWAQMIEDEPEGQARQDARIRFAERLQQIQRSYRMLVDGDPALDIPPVPEGVRQYFYGPLDSYDALLKQFLSEAEQYLLAHGPAVETPPDVADHHMISTWSIGPLANSQQRITEALQDHAAKAFHRLWLSQTIILTLTLLLLAFAGLYLLRNLLLKSAQVVREHLSAQRRLMAIIDSVEDGIIEVNPDGSLIFANRSAALTLGQSSDQLTQSTLQSFTRLSGSDGVHIGVALERMERATAAAILLTRPDGTCFRAALTLTPIEGQSRAIITVRDITRHLHREERLRKLSHAVEHSPAPVIITDFTGVIEYVNPAFTTVSGWTSREVIGHSPRMISSGAQERDVYHAMWNDLKAGKSWRGEFRNRRKDGASYWVRSSIAPIMDDSGSISHFVAVQEDVTVERQALQDLEDSRRRLREAIDSLPQGFAIYNPDETLLMCNDAYRAVYGTQVPAIREGQRFDTIIRVGLESRAYALKPGQEEDFFAQRLDLFRRGGEREIELKSGRWVLASETITPSGAHVCLRTDISDIKRIQTELESARRHADEANTAKSQFLSSMSHELRTPLNAILGFAQLLQMNRKTPLTERQGDQVQQILRAGQHLLSLIDEILDLAKIEAGKIPLHMAPVDVATMARDCQDLIQPAADSANLTMTVTAPSGVWVFADHTRLKQILLNLLSNAVKYNTPDGKLWLNIAPSLTPPEGKSGPWIVFSVSDTGLGIPEEMRNQLFQPFSRLGRDTSMVEGTGIGLALTRQLVELMGGELTVSHLPSGGTCFSFALPQTDGATQITL